MTRRVARALTLLAVLAATSAGCAVGTATTRSLAAPSPTAVAVVAVSASHPTPDAAAALDRCGLTHFETLQPGTAVGNNLSIGIVTGMGLVTPGRDVSTYVALGRTPEIETDEPIWVITTDATWISFPMVDYEMRNATCIVTGGPYPRSTWIVTGDTRLNGVITTPEPEPPATLRLPALAP